MKNYYVFDGQNASTGEPNKVTGRMSFYGTVYSFESKKEALEYVADKDQDSAHQIIVAGTKSAMRGYCLGCSVADFVYNIEQGPVMKKDENTQAWEEIY